MGIYIQIQEFNPKRSMDGKKEENSQSSYGEKPESRNQGSFLRVCLKLSSGSMILLTFSWKSKMILHNI